MSDLAELLDAICRFPRLADALCRGMWSAFDPADPGEDPADTRHRHQAALALCRSCPALAGCEQWFANLPPRERPRGVVAGRIYLPRAGRADNNTDTTTEEKKP